jgi:hypothetical protein
VIINDFTLPWRAAEFGLISQSLSY